MPHYAIPVAHASAHPYSQPKKKKVYNLNAEPARPMHAKCRTSPKVKHATHDNAHAEDHLNNDQLLHLIALAAVHPVPRSVCQRAANGPHDGNGGLECACDESVTLNGKSA